MFSDDRIVDIAELEEVGTELTKEIAEKKPRWGSGNISVNDKGEWNWLARDWDTSG